MLDQLKNISSTRKDLKNFGLTVGIVLVIISLVQWIFDKSIFPYFLSAGILLIILGALIPTVLKPLQKLWMAIAIIIGWFMNRLIMSILFYSAFTTISVGSKLFGKRFIELKPDQSQSSYWNKRELREYDRRDCEKQF